MGNEYVLDDIKRRITITEIDIKNIKDCGLNLKIDTAVLQTKVDTIKDDITALREDIKDAAARSEISLRSEGATRPQDIKNNIGEMKTNIAVIQTNMNRSYMITSISEEISEGL